jgi:hypothetical protein
MEPTGCPETSVPNYHCTLRNIPEGRSSHLRRGGSMKSCIRFGHHRKHTAFAKQNQQKYFRRKQLFPSSKNRWMFQVVTNHY